MRVPQRSHENMYICQSVCLRSKKKHLIRNVQGACARLGIVGVRIYRRSLLKVFAFTDNNTEILAGKTNMAV